MPIVKYIPAETNLPTAVAREMTRYTANSLVEVSDYEAYRNAALKIDKKPIKYDAEALYAFADKLQEDAEDEREYDEAGSLRWAIGNTKVRFWRDRLDAAIAKSGKREKDFDADGWVEAQGDRNKFEASLFGWAKQDSHTEHPAVLLTMLLDKYGYGQKGTKHG